MIKELKLKTDQELAILFNSLKLQLLQMRFKQASGEAKGLHKLKEIRKTIARVLTVLSQRQIKISSTVFGIQLISQKGIEMIKTNLDLKQQEQKNE